MEEIDHSIPHCKGTKCKLRKDCLRYIAHKDAIARQYDVVPYLDDIPFVDDKNYPYCDAFYAIDNK